MDGVFGSGTAQAVRNFQQSKGLGADGVVGPDTWAALVGGSAGSGNPGGGDRASLAQRLIDGNRVTLATSHASGCGVGDGASASANLNSTRGGAAAGRSSYDCSSSLPAAPGGSVFLDTILLSGMLELAERYTYSVSEIAGGSTAGIRVTTPESPSTSTASTAAR